MNQLCVKSFDSLDILAILSQLLGVEKLKAPAILQSLNL